MQGVSLCRVNCNDSYNKHDAGFIRRGEKQMNRSSYSTREDEGADAGSVDRLQPLHQPRNAADETRFSVIDGFRLIA
jgi:hypothetical protein